jgi:fatty-acyl-CoA synthase
MTGTVDYVDLQARLQPSRLAACDLLTGERWTYRQFDRAVSQYAALLVRKGVTAGARVAALAKNRAALPLLHLACARLGAIYVPLNWRLAAGELSVLIADCEPHLVLGDAMLQTLGVTGDSLDDFGADAADCEPLPLTLQDDTAPSLILYTSGTSGKPKGVLLSERNIWRTALNFSLLAKVDHNSVFLCDSPMFHVIGLVTNVRPALMRGGAMMISDGFIPARTLARLGDRELRVTHYFCVPQMAASLRADPAFNADNLRGITGIFSGGAPHAADAIRAWTNDGIPIADGFGMSETGTATCMPLDVNLISEKAGAAGLPPPGFEIRILDAQGADCPTGTAGELVVRGENVTTGYWRRPTESAAAFTPDGWLRTGDIGRFDADGYLWLIDRKKDMFISGGENVYPAEIEGALAAYPDLAECAVIGVPDERWGEVGHLAVVPRNGAEIAAPDVMQYLEQRLARYKLPKHLTILDHLPRNGAGKLVKAELRNILK